MTTLEFHTTHQHPTLGELQIGFSVGRYGEIHSQIIRLRQGLIYEAHLHKNRETGCLEAVWFRRKWRNGIRRDTCNNEHPDVQPFLADLNTFAQSGRYRRIIHRVLDAAILNLQRTRDNLAVLP